MIVKLFRNCRIYTPKDDGAPLAGGRLGSLHYLEASALLCVDGLIAAVGPEAEVRAAARGLSVDLEIDCRGGALIPGFVDPHTHMCFSASREEEFILRLQGTPYLEILKQGGGILSSVRQVREASEEELLAKTLQHCQTALGLGTTTVEIKSGYGLDTETELKMLRVIDAAGRRTPQDVVATFLGAHALPPEFKDRPDDFVDLVIDEMIPAVAQQQIARFCDVFCEEGVFTLEQSRRILQAAAKAGLGLKIHADEVNDTGGAGLAAELKAASAEHLLAANDANLKALAAAGVVAVLLPATAYSLRKPYARARKMIELGVPVALATDCNPGSSFTESMLFIFGLAVMQMGLSPEEALAAATLNGAYALGLAERLGSLEPGKQADMVLLDGKTPAVLAYHAGVPPVKAVYKKGEKVA